MKIGKYDFEYVCEIKPMGGVLVKCMPQSLYKNEKRLILNAYGKGPFCKFKIPENYKISGVYALFINDEVKYIGECKNLSARYNNGYGNISPRNCFKGGQETNCRLNNLIYKNLKLKNKIYLYFYKTKFYKNVEKELRGLVKASWNKV